ncbi:MAG: hypothetical protein ACLPY5_10540, partial [Candidatus Bathyarchaeia archaeon]
ISSGSDLQTALSNAQSQITNMQTQITNLQSQVQSSYLIGGVGIVIGVIAMLRGKKKTRKNK